MITMMIALGREVAKKMTISDDKCSSLPWCFAARTDRASRDSVAAIEKKTGDVQVVLHGSMTKA